MVRENKFKNLQGLLLFKKSPLSKDPKKNSPFKKTTIIRKQPIAMEMFLNFHLLSIIFSGKIKNRNFEKKGLGFFNSQILKKI